MERRLKSNMLQDNGKNFLAAPCHSKNDRAINNDTLYDVAILAHVVQKVLFDTFHAEHV